MLREKDRCKKDKGDKNESEGSEPNQVTPKAKKATRNKNQSICNSLPQIQSLKQKSPKKAHEKFSDK